MRQRHRRLVVAWEERPNDGPSAHLWPKSYTAVLECGHRQNIGVCAPTAKRMACQECGIRNVTRGPQ